MNGKKYLENYTFDELTIGQSVTVSRTLLEKDIELFAILSGDVNPAHLDEDYAKKSYFKGIIGHGMWSGALISATLGTALPGPGTIYLSQNLEFKKPVHLGDKVSVTITVKEKRAEKHIVVLDCICTNLLGDVVVSGAAVVIAPTVKIRTEYPDLPDVEFHNHDRFKALIDSCCDIEPMRTAVVHPVKDIAIKAMYEAHLEKMIIPILVGPKNRIIQAAQEAGIDISGFELIDTPHSHASAEKATELASKNLVDSIMKGSIETDELMSAVISGAYQLKTERRISHSYLLDIPAYHKLLIVTDAAINIAPDLDVKADICRNAIYLWRTITSGAALPKVAILAATEKVKSDIEATVHAACLCKMADRKQIVNALIDGPLAIDLAINQQALIEKDIESNVAGDADILVAPDIHSANMLAKQLIILGGADAAGIVLGAKVPIILTSRADSVRTRIMSCALAMRVVKARKKGEIK